MKIKSSWLLVAVFAAFPGSAEVPANIEQELIALEHAWTAAVVKKDAPFLRELLAAEYIYTATDGTVLNKLQDIAEVTSGKINLRSFKLSEVSVRLYGDTAIVTGLNELIGAFQGVYLGGPHRFTDVLVRRDGRWQVVSSQATLATKVCNASTSIADQVGGDTYKQSRYVPC